MKWIIFLLTISSAAAVEIQPGKYRFCTVIMEHEKSPVLAFNFGTRHTMRVDLKGPLADNLIVEKKEVKKLLTIHVLKSYLDQRVIEATVIAARDCEKDAKALTRIGKNFTPQ